MNNLTNPLQEGIELFRQARKSFLEGAQLLHSIREGRLWEGSYGSFGEYVEDGCHLSQGFASKLLKVYESYVIQGGMEPSSLQGTDPEKLYLAISTKGTAHERFARAATLSRTELREEITEKPPCAHETTIHICASCRERVE